MKFSRRAVTASRPVITRSPWAEVRSQFLYEIIDKVLQHNIPDELIINVDQTASKLGATNNITMAAKEEKHISRTGTTDKRAITVTLSQSLDDCMLPSSSFLPGKQKDLYQTSLFLMDSASLSIRNIRVMRPKLYV